MLMMKPLAKQNQILLKNTLNTYNKVERKENIGTFVYHWAVLCFPPYLVYFCLAH